MSDIVVSELYFSKSVHSHYHRSRSKAIAFLFTIGAKALVIASQQCSIYKIEAINGINDEAKIKHDMDIEERIRYIKRQIFDRESITVHKLSRTGHTRVIHLKLNNDKSVGSSMSWKSGYIKKKFFFDKDLSIVSLDTQPLDVMVHSVEYRNHFCERLNGSTHSLPFIRFENQNRQVNIQFGTYVEMIAFLQCVDSSQSYLRLFAPESPPQQS